MILDKKVNKRDSEIIEWIDKTISELVYDKVKIIKAYNYYHGKRDPEQFRHLEENYGIGTATSVEFVPLVKKHIDVLVGEYISVPLQPHVSCKDKETLSNIFEDKKKAINSTAIDYLSSLLKKTVSNDPNKPQDPESELEKILVDFERNFISDYEIAAQNIVDWANQARIIDFLEKRKTLLIDLLVSGTCYYKVEPSSSDGNINLRILNPINTFIDRNPNSPYLKDSYRSVIREYMTKDQILEKYGEYLDTEELESLENYAQHSYDGTGAYVRAYDTTSSAELSDGILGGFEITPLLPFERSSVKDYRLYPVFEVEIIKTKKEGGKFVSYRHEGVRIGSTIYIPIGESKNVVRSKDEPTKCRLSINGTFYLSRNGDPFSLILATANLQDKFDVLNFYRDNIISESGSVGDWVDLPYIPKILGGELTERLMKWKAYKKQGIALIDSSQEGNPPMNTTFGGYDDTLKLQTIQAIDLAIQRIEETCSTITGVFREKLGGIEQKDAVTNVQVGVRQSSYITKQYYQVMDNMVRDILIDILDIAKIVYKDGFSGIIVLGERLNKIFTALPEHFTVTDHDIHIDDSAETIKELEIIKQIAMEFAKGNAINPEVILEVITSSGLTKLKENVGKALSVQRKENNQLQQAMQQNEQLNQQLKEAQSQLQKMQSELETAKKASDQIAREKLEFEKELGWYKARTENSYKQELLEWEKKRVELEGLQLLDANKQNDEIKNK